MARKISQLTSASSVTTADLIPIVTGGVTKRATVAQIAGTGGASGKAVKAMANANATLTADEAAKSLIQTTGTGHTLRRTLTVPAPASAAESYTRTFLNSCTPSGADLDAGTVTLSVGTGNEVDIEPGSKAIVEFSTDGVRMVADLPLDPRDFGCPWDGVSDDLPGLILLQQSIPAYRERPTKVQLPKRAGWCSDDLPVFRKLEIVGHGKATFGRDSAGIRFAPLKSLLLLHYVGILDTAEAGGYGIVDGTVLSGANISSQVAIVSDEGGSFGRAMHHVSTTYDVWEQLPTTVGKGTVVLKSGVGGAAVPTAVAPAALDAYGDGHTRDTTHLVWFRCTTSGTKGSAKPAEMADGSATGLANIGTTIAATGGTAVWTVESIPKDYANGASVVLGQRVFLPGDNAHTFECIDLNGASATATGESTTLHADMNGLALAAQVSIRVASTAGFPTSGILRVTTSTGFSFVSYTGKTTGPDTFTGLDVVVEVRSPTGNMSTGGTVTGPYTRARWGVPVRLFNRMYQPAHRAEFYDVETTTTGTATLPQATIAVTSTSGFADSGSLQVWTGAAYETVTYTGRTETSFTGCAGGTGVFAVAAEVGQGVFWREIHNGLVSCQTNWLILERAQITGGTGCAIWISPSYKRTVGTTHFGAIKDLRIINCGNGLKFTTNDANGWSDERCTFHFMGGGRTNVDGPDYLNRIAAPVVTNWTSGRFGNAGDVVTDRALGLNFHGKHYVESSGGQGYRNDLHGSNPFGNASTFEHPAHELSVPPNIYYPATVLGAPHGVSAKSDATVFSGNGSRNVRTEAPLVSNAAKSVLSNHGPQRATTAGVYEFSHSDDDYPVAWKPSEDLTSWNAKWWVLGKGGSAGWLEEQVLAFPRPGAGATYPTGGSTGGVTPPWLCQDYAVFGRLPNLDPNALGFASSLAAINALTAYFTAGSFFYNRGSATGVPLGWLCVTSGTPGTWQAVYPSLRGDVTIATADANVTPTADQLTKRTIVLTGANTADRDLLLPVPAADADGNEWVIDASGVTGAFNTVVKHVGGAGTTVNIANGKTAIVRTNTGGVKRQTADV